MAKKTTTNSFRIGVDIGGTFTDIVLLNENIFGFLHSAVTARLWLSVIRIGGPDWR